MRKIKKNIRYLKLIQGTQNNMYTSMKIFYPYYYFEKYDIKQIMIMRSTT